MRFDALYIFLILLFGLLLCSFLGGNCCVEGFDNNIAQQTGVTGAESELCDADCEADKTKEYDNYNHYDGDSTKLINGAAFYGPNGGKVVAIVAGNGKQYLEITPPNSSTPILFTWKSPSSATTSYGSITTFYGPNGGTATVVKTADGQRGIQVSTTEGTTIYTANQSQYSGTQIDPNYNSSYPPVNTGSVTTPSGNTTYYAASDNGVATATVNNSDNTYSNYLPAGIPANQIPAGQEDLYILKSSVVPPVCPMCPSMTVPRQEPCPACPACERCPEPAFECKKVPNYDAANSGSSSNNSSSMSGTSSVYGYGSSGSSSNQGYSNIPTAVLADFSTFGM